MDKHIAQAHVGVLSLLPAVVFHHFLFTASGRLDLIENKGGRCRSWEAVHAQSHRLAGTFSLQHASPSCVPGIANVGRLGPW